MFSHFSYFSSSLYFLIVTTIAIAMHCHNHHIITTNHNHLHEYDHLECDCVQSAFSTYSSFSSAAFSSSQPIMIHLTTLHVYTLFLWMLRLKNPEQPSQLKTQCNAIKQEIIKIRDALRKNNGLFGEYIKALVWEVNRSPVYSIMLPRAAVSTNLNIDLLKEPSREYCDNLDD